MPVLRLERVSKIYPTGEVLRDVTWEVKAGDRIGLVGVNGAGKSTQMRIIAGMEEPSSGQVVKQGDPRIVYLQQEFDVDLSRTVRQELFQAFGEAAEVLNRQRQVEEEMGSEKAAEDPDHLNDLIHELGALQTRFENLHGYELDARIDKLLPTIGFTAEGAEQLVGDYSGGWQMRIALGKVLLQEPDLLLLDEPTNHLDVETIQWLEDYLIGQTCPLVVISHDRAFLDRVCNQIVETERGVSRSYLGNYSQHLELKALEREAGQAAFERQQKELATQQAYIDRFRASATRSTQAKSREKLLDKVERIEAPIESVSGPRFQFPPAPRSGRLIAEIKELSHSYGEQILFLGANLEVERGDRIAFVGPNGAGKSTLTNLLSGDLPPTSGSITLDGHDITGWTPEKISRHRLGRSYQKTNIFRSFTVWDNVRLAAQSRAQPNPFNPLGWLGRADGMAAVNARAERAIELAGLQSRRHTLAGAASHGEQRQLEIAMTLATEPVVLLLDEPLAGMGVAEAENMVQLLLRLKKDHAMMLVEHDIDAIFTLADHLTVMVNGQVIASDAPAAVRADRGVQAAYLGEEHLWAPPLP